MYFFVFDRFCRSFHFRILKAGLLLVNAVSIVKSRQIVFKGLNEGKQTKKTRLEKIVAICRGSLAWLGRQTHNLDDGKIQMRNLEFARGKRLQPEVAGSNPAPGTTF
jgi:hypothetical protein